MAFLALPALHIALLPAHVAQCDGLRPARMRPCHSRHRGHRRKGRGVAVAAASSASVALEAWKSVRKHRYTPPSVEAHLQQTGKAVAERGLWSIGMDLLERARVWKVKVSLDVYKDILKACERSAQDRAAVKLLQLLHAQTAPDVDTYRLVVSSILRARKLLRRKVIKSHLEYPVDDAELMEVVEEMWEELPEASPTAVQIAALEITASTGDLPRTLRAFEAMEGLKQDLDAFCALLLASGQAKQPEATKAILKEAIQHFGHEARLYQKGVLSLWTARAHSDALKLIEVARERGIRVDPVMCEAWYPKM
eukprot:s2921_g2.t1